MTRFGAVLLMFFALAPLAGAAGQERPPSAGASSKDPITRARALYNDGKFDGAIAASDQARLVAVRADSADLIAARAYLERFRQDAATDDLTQARERLRRLNPQRLGGRERVEFLVGLGETLFLDESFGAAAGIFDSVLARRDSLTPDARERVLDWWASALDRDARPRSDIERQGVYQRIRDRMQDEIAARPGSAAASYWLSAAARGQGDLQAAWDAAQAGWVRAPLADDHGTTLRADLDQLMQRAIVPERSRVLSQPADALRQEWERFKDRWTK